MHRIILPGEVGSQIEPRLTAEGIRQLIRDRRDAGEKVPTYIVVSEYDRRELNQDVLGMSVGEVDKADRTPDHDGKAIALIEGVMVRSHPDVPRGRARLVFSAEERKIENRLGGEGLIIVGAGL
jgi:hypothetical protein